MTQSEALAEPSHNPRAAYRRRVPIGLRRPIWLVRAVPRRIGQWLRWVFTPGRYWFGDDDTGPGPSSAVESIVDRAEARLVPVWSGLDRACGADRSVPSALAIRLDRVFDVDSNSFAIERLRNRFENHLQTDVAGRTCVEIGPGAHNPYSLLVLLALLGARHAIGIEPAPVYDEAVAAVAAARAAAFLLTAPQLIARDHPVDQHLLLDNAAQFDFAKLWAGDLSGLDGSVVELRQAPIYESGLDAGSVDYVFSNSTLEHLARPADGVAELARITACGGTSEHFIDGVDHNVYAKPGTDPIGFLAVDTPHALVNGSNRVRPLSFRDLFVEQGFETVSFVVDESVAVDDLTRRRFVEPWRSMSPDYLSVRKAFIEMARL